MVTFRGGFVGIYDTGLLRSKTEKPITKKKKEKENRFVINSYEYLTSGHRATLDTFKLQHSTGS